MTTSNRQKAHNDIDNIFYNILPKHGMKPREEQIKLCHCMFETMTGSDIALCDAGVGIGKTFSYLVAGAMYKKYYADKARLILISTASIALQNTIITEYIPFLSDVLLKENMINMPFQAVIRKGKSHYACDDRYVKRLRKANMDKKNPKHIQALMAIWQTLDLDGVSHLSSYDKDQICVPETCNCRLSDCRYKKFVRQSRSPEYIYQICNHNFLIADSIHRRDKLPPLLPECCAVVVDEAHKLPNAARQMFGKAFTQGDAAELISGLKAEQFILAGQKAKECLKPLLADLNSIDFQTSDTAGAGAVLKRHIEGALKVLLSIQKTLMWQISTQLSSLLSEIIKTLVLFKEQNRDYILYAAKDDYGKPALFATLADMDSHIKMALWNRNIPMILTSGTLAVNDDFSRFKDKAGLNKLRRIITESVSHSPFDYENNCLLYFPKFMPSPNDQAGVYYSGIAREIAKIINATHGHALVLFTSYTAMSAVCAKLKNLPYPMFVMGRNDYRTIEEFKLSGNGVLFATGAAWEGIDFPGDIVSSLIIVRLPFPIPDPLSERKKQRFPDLQSFISSIIIPDMQIKLKQGFGRAIRTETDTCVISILDERSLMGRRYMT